MASVVPTRETLVTGFVGDEDEDFMPFEIYRYAGETKVSVNGGMFTRIVPADSIRPFKKNVLDNNSVRVWEILPEISGPWRTTMPTLPNRAAFYAPPIEAPFKPRDPAIHGPMLAVRLRNLTRRIQRTRLARDRARARARARGRTSPNTQRTLKPLLRIPDTGTSLSNSNGTSKSKSKSKSRSRKRHEY